MHTVDTCTVCLYSTNLTPLTSALHPHMSAHNRLVSWKPANMTGHPLILTDEFINWVEQVLVNGYAKSTLETYTLGLLAFHVFCDSRSIPEEQHAPCSTDLLNIWIATTAGSFAGASVKNYVHSLRTWHIIHGDEWKIGKASLDTIIHSAERLQPDRAHRKKRVPFTPSHISKLLEDLDHSNPFDAACGTCLTPAFYCATRVGELTVPKQPCNTCACL
ncbi:hypothetical protein F5877DRAFT_55301 [Lentinula edodes]|nr:hypothetical protein F5877DRAFT_55301 [Lentinula edodes]